MACNFFYYAAISQSLPGISGINYQFVSHDLIIIKPGLIPWQKLISNVETGQYLRKWLLSLLRTTT
jgi:hypothetical protein